MKSKNGLPLEIKYCVECNLINQRTTGKNEYFHTENSIHKTVEFNEQGVCAGCSFVKKEFDKTVNWEEREKELISEAQKEKLLEKYHISAKELPRMLKTDAAIAALNVKPGDVIKIIRTSETAGEALFYRVIVDV